MRMHLIFASLITVSSPAVTASAPAGPGPRPLQQGAAQCQAHFNANKGAIEALAAAGDGAGIKAIMARGGCATSLVKLPARPAGKAATFKIECKTFQLSPEVKIDCTISWLTAPKTPTR